MAANAAVGVLAPTSCTPSGASAASMATRLSGSSSTNSTLGALLGFSLGGSGAATSDSTATGGVSETKRIVETSLKNYASSRERTRPQGGDWELRAGTSSPDRAAR